MGIRIVVCDDIKEHLSYMQRLIQKNAQTAGREVSILPFSNPNALLTALLEQEVCADIAVLDIAMEGLDGISLAKRLNALSPHCQIIFITAYSNYAMDAYEAEHVYLVLKDQMESGLWRAIEKAIVKLEAIRESVLPVKTTDGTRLCAYSEIRYLEHNGRKTNVITGQGTIATKTSIAAVSRVLPEYFCRCHQSFVVNLNFVAELNKDCFVLRDATRVPISRANRRAVEQAFWSHLNARILR